MYVMENKASAVRDSQERVSTLISDSGTEYLSNECKEYLRFHKTGAPYTPQQNGVAERVNRTLLEKSRAMVMDSKGHSWKKL